MRRDEPRVERGSRVGSPATSSRTSLAAGGGLLVLGTWVFWSWDIDHGSVVTLERSYANFLFVYAAHGLATVLLLAEGLRPALRWRPLLARAAAVPFRRWAVACALLSALAATTYRLVVLRELPLADDEASYRFSAQLLLDGRLSAPSHPLKIFFDQSFMINDGRYYSQYFLGWPALLAPFVAVGIGGYANAAYGAGFLVLLFLILRRLLGDGWARAGSLLALFSPFLLFLSASSLSHTSCLLALAATVYAAVRLTEAAGETLWSTGWSIALAAAFSIAFFIRPQSALPVGLPFLIWPLWRRWAAAPGSDRPIGAFRAATGRCLTAFALTALPFAVAFLGANAAQNGSPWKTGYARLAEYSEENLYRFTHFRPDRGFNFDFASLEEAALQSVVAIARFDFVSLGWPFALLFAILAIGRRHAAPFLASGVLLWAMFFFTTSPGIDSLGPVHYAEAMLPFLVLTAMGMQRVHSSLAASWDAEATPALASFVTCCILVSLAFYLPTRARAHARLAAQVERPLAATHGLSSAIVFAGWPLDEPCPPEVSRPLVFWWPLNDPGLDNDVLWANHVSIEDDRRLMREHFPERTGFVLARPAVGCDLHLVPLEEADTLDTAWKLPRGLPGGLRGQPDALEQGWIP